MTFRLQCDEPASVAILDRAASGGITFLDTADVYQLGGSLETVGRTEEVLGRWLGPRRHDFVIATKCFGAMSARPWGRGSSRKHILDAIEGSLRRLRTDYVDLYQLHHPDAGTPLDETLRALDDIVRAGKARYGAQMRQSGLGIEFEDTFEKYRLWQDPERVLAETTPCQRANNVDAVRAREVVQDAFGPLPSARDAADSPPSQRRLPLMPVLQHIGVIGEGTCSKRTAVLARRVGADVAHAADARLRPGDASNAGRQAGARRGGRMSPTRIARRGSRGNSACPSFS